MCATKNLARGGQIIYAGVIPCPMFYNDVTHDTTPRIYTM